MGGHRHDIAPAEHPGKGRRQRSADLEESRMHRLIRIARAAGLAAATAAIAASLTAAGALAASPLVGYVYVNNNTAGQNTVAGFDRHADGSLSPIPGSPFDAGGAGTGTAFGSAGGLQQSTDGRYILATDPASNDISVLRIKPNGSLQLAEVQDSNGSAPSSIAVHGSLVYVANGGAGGSNYTGFRLNAGGHLSPIAGSTYALPDTALPGHVLISPDGTRLVATRVGPSAGPSYLDGFAIDRDGRLTAAPGSPFPAQKIGPFGSAFSPTNPDQLFVSNAHDGAGAGSVSVYDVAANGSLTAIAGSPFADNQTAPCWVAISPDGQALFAVNTASGSVSRYTVESNGTLGLVGSTPLAGPAPRKVFDAAVSPDGDFLYIVNAVGAISALSVDGTTITELPGSPISTGGAPFGIVVD
jgi:DNA-binding beta-propeller fold protein YncE